MSKPKVNNMYLVVKKLKKAIKKTIKYLIYLCIVAIVIFGIVSFVKYVNEYTEYTYQLQEIEDGTYAIYYTTHSRIPAENYEVIRLYYNNSIYTLNGNVSITYTNGEPYVYIKKTNIVHGDEIHAYVPKGSVKHEKSINIGR